MLKCPACKGRLLEKNVAGMTVDVCYGGCGGIWFDASELERVDARSAATLHTVWQRDRDGRSITGPRLCPRCPEQTLDRKWFSSVKKVEIDQCEKCAGIWLDDGEFTSIYNEMKASNLSARDWAVALAKGSAVAKEMPRPAGDAPHV